VFPDCVHPNVLLRGQQVHSGGHNETCPSPKIDPNETPRISAV